MVFFSTLHNFASIILFVVMESFTDVFVMRPFTVLIMFLDSGKKPKNPEETHADLAIPNTYWSELRIEPGTLKWWGSNTNSYAAVLPRAIHGVNLKMAKRLLLRSVRYHIQGKSVRLNFHHVSYHVTSLTYYTHLLLINFFFFFFEALSETLCFIFFKYIIKVI